MKRALALAMLGMGTGCAHHASPPLTAVSPLPWLPPIPIDTTRPGLDVREMPSAETVARSERTVRVSAEVERAMLERRPVTIAYPAEARRDGRAGHVQFRAIIARDGSVQGLSVVEASDPVFVRAATASVQSWQYRPYLVNGQAVAVDTMVRVDFASDQ